MWRADHRSTLLYLTTHTQSKHHSMASQLEFMRTQPLANGQPATTRSPYATFLPSRALRIIIFISFFSSSFHSTSFCIPWLIHLPGSVHSYSFLHSSSLFFYLTLYERPVRVSSRCAVAVSIHHIEWYDYECCRAWQQFLSVTKTDICIFFSSIQCFKTNNQTNKRIHSVLEVTDSMVLNLTSYRTPGRMLSWWLRQFMMIFFRSI